MSWKAITTEADYQKAVKRMIMIFHAEETTPEGKELLQLLVLMNNYEDNHIQVPGPDSVEILG